MPNVTIATRTGWITDKSAVIEAVHGAMREALKLPEWDRTLRLLQHGPDEFAVPPGRGERFTLVEITMFSGRSTEAKRNLYRALARNLEAIGVPPLDLKVTLIETPPENWGIRGGQLASEVDLGFEIRV